MQAIIGDFSATISRARVWQLMAEQDIALRYRRSLIGPFWISLSLAAMCVGIALLYGQIFKQPFKEFLVFISASLLGWMFLNNMMTEACTVVQEAEAHLKNIPLPIPILAARVVYRNLIIFLHNLLVVGIVILAVGAPITFNLAFAIIGILALCALGYFGAIVLGPLCARFRDIGQVVANGMQVLFYLSPILWRPKQIGLNSPVVQLNPIFHLVELIRQPMLGHVPTVENFVVVAVLVLVTFLLAVLTLGLTRRKIFLWL